MSVPEVRVYKACGVMAGRAWAGPRLAGTEEDSILCTDGGHEPADQVFATAQLIAAPALSLAPSESPGLRRALSPGARGGKPRCCVRPIRQGGAVRFSPGELPSYKTRFTITWNFKVQLQEVG